MPKEKKETTNSIKALVEKKEGKLTAIASSEVKDRMGDTILISGWQLKNFKKNPVIPFAHNYSEMPVGIAKKLRIEGKNLIFEPEFHEITQLAREVKAMYEADPPIMKAFSVGFIPLETEDVKKDEKGFFGPQIIKKAELLEISAVPVPANQEALTLEKGITENEKKEICKWMNGKLECKKEGIEITNENVKEILNEGAEALKENTEKEKEEIIKDEKKEEKFNCECLDCGYKMETDKHCKDIKCPKCNGKMRRIERPGQGKEIEERIEEIKKELAELKEGRVLSGKNRELISVSIKTLNKAVAALQELLEATELAKSGEKELSKGRDPEKAQKLLRDRVIVRALQKMSGDLSHILENIKKERENNE